LQTGNAWKSRIGQTIMVIVAAIVALIAALIVVPPLALKVGLFEKHVGYATVAVAFLIVFVAARRVKSLNQKPADKTATTRRKR
jgi:hypothetical protein